MLSKKLSISFLIILVLLSLSTTTKAQNSSTTGDVVGNVKDAQGLAIVGANVTIEEAATGITKTVSVREDGIYNFSSLRPGKYKILVKKEGFANIERETNVRLGSSTIENISLTTGETSYLVEVNSNSLLETKTENSTSIEQNQIQNLPINQRRYLDFAFTTPRITPDRLPADAITATSGLSVNGQSARFNSLTIDGLANNDYVLGAGRSTFNQDSVQEFQVVSDSYAAEFGRAIGGIINIVTKSGGNDLHSRLFLLNRNSTISAREAFSPTKSDTKQYQFGLTLSSPIKKIKRFSSLLLNAQLVN